jgi:hypothetical protein
MYSITPGMPEVFGTWCVGACTVTEPPPTPGGITSVLALLPPPRPTAYRTTTPMITAATTAIAPMVIRLRRRSARFCWARMTATRSRRAACLPFFAFGTGSLSPLRCLRQPGYGCRRMNGMARALADPAIEAYWHTEL